MGSLGWVVVAGGHLVFYYQFCWLGMSGNSARKYVHPFLVKARKRVAQPNVWFFVFLGDP